MNLIVNKMNFKFYINSVALVIVLLISPYITGIKLIIFLGLQIIINLISINYKSIKYKPYIRIYYITILLIIYLSVNGSEYYRSIIIIYSNILIFYFSYLNYKNLFENKSKFYKLLKLIHIISICLSIYGIYEYITQSNPIFLSLFNDKYHNIFSDINNNMFFSNAGNYRISSSFQHPIIVANVSLLFIMINALLYNEFNKKKYLIAIVGNLVLLYITFSRSSYLSLVISIIIYILMYIKIINGKMEYKQGIVYFLKLLLGIFVGIIFINLPIIRGESLLNVILSRFVQLFGVQDSGSLLQRIEGIKYIIDEFLKSNFIVMLFGHGYGTAGQSLIVNNIVLVAEGYYVIDNQYASFLYEIGIFNLGMLLCLGIVKLKNLLEILKGKSDFKIKRSLLISLGGIFSFLISFVAYDAITWITIAYLFGLVLAIFNFYKEQNLNK